MNTIQEALEKLAGKNINIIRALVTAELEDKRMTDINWHNTTFKGLEFEHEGIECKIIRTGQGHLCGYVRPHMVFSNSDFEHADQYYDAPGGITYVTEDWIGFDCAHSGQMSPIMEARMIDFKVGFENYLNNDEYITLEEVIEYTKSLAHQVNTYNKA